MKRIEKLIALLLITCCLFAIISPGVCAESIMASGKCTDDMFWTLNTSGCLTISGVGEMPNYSLQSPAPWHNLREKITLVYIDGYLVESIGSYAFYNCTYLKEVYHDTTLKSIGERAFSGCRSLQKAFDASKVEEIGEYAFENCTSLTSIIIPNMRKIANGTFAGCANLEWISYSDYDTVWFNHFYLNDIGDYAFADCCSLTSIIIPQTVLSVGKCAFSGCRALSYVQIVGSVINIGEEAFKDCQSLTSISIPEGVSSIGDRAFRNSGLTYVSLPSSVTEIGDHTFSGCPFLTGVWVNKDNPSFFTDDNGALYNKEQTELYVCPKTISGQFTIPDGITSIAPGAFSSCEKLTDIKIPNSITSIGEGAFEKCCNLKEITIPDSVTSIGSEAFLECYKLVKVILPAGLSDIKEYSFFGCNGLSDILIPGSVTNIDKCAFNGCYSLAGIILPKALTSIGERAFSYSGLKQITIPEGVTYIGEQAFANCRDLTAVSIPGSVTSIGKNAFLECSSLAGISVSLENQEYLNDDTGALYNKAKTDLIVCPKTLKGTYTVSSTIKRILPGAFSNCVNLSAVVVPDGVVSIGEYAFCGCTALERVKLPSSLTSIGDSAFQWCRKLSEIRIPNGITHIGDCTFDLCENLASVSLPTSLTSIGDSAFSMCSSLKSIVMPKTVKSIERSAFYCCENLQAVCFKGSAPQIDSSAFTMYNDSERIIIPGLTFYYIEGNADWTYPTWNSYITSKWDGINIPGRIEPVSLKFEDVPENAWYAKAVKYAVSNNLMNGVGSRQFDPDGSMTRAMLVTVLWRYAWEPEEGTNTFSDVPNGQWYSKAVAWAAQNGVVNGTGNGKFDPDGKITREQLAAILYRFSNIKGVDTSSRSSLSSFPDGSKTSSWAIEAVKWTVAEGIIGGSNGKLLPQGNATRAQVATILMRYMEETESYNNAANDNKTIYYSDYYSLTLPEDWVGHCNVNSYSDGVYFVHTESVNAGYGGFLFSINLEEKASDYNYRPAFEFIGYMTIGAKKYHVVVYYPSDVQFGEPGTNIASQYMTMAQQIPSVLESITPLNGAIFER